MGGTGGQVQETAVWGLTGEDGQERPCGGYGRAGAGNGRMGVTDKQAGKAAVEQLP